MKTAIRTLLAFSTTLVFGAATMAFAADTDPLRINVPFAFKAGKANLPAGEYMVYEDDSKVITLKGTHGSAIVLGVPTSEADTSRASVTFDHTSEGYVLKCVHTWGKSVSSLIPTVQSEK